MKKILSFVILALSVLCVNAQEANELEKVYLQDCAVQIGTKAVVKVIVSHDTSKGCIGSMQFNYSFDDGIVVRDNNQDVVGVGATTVNDKTNFVLLGGMESTTAAAPDGACVCVFNIDIPADMTLGEHPMSISNIMAVYEDGITAFELDQVESTMTVQKSAVIEPQRGDYALEAVPTCVSTGATSMSIPVNFANDGYVDNISFNIEYPAGMLTTKSGKNYNLTVNKERFDTGSDATLTVKATSGTAVAFTNAESDLVKPGNGNLLTIPVTLTNVADGVYTIKFTDIKVSVTNDEADPISTETLPDYYVSVIVGQPSTLEAILYGNYNEATASAFTTALKNVAVANITSAEIDGDAMGKLQDVITVDDNKKWVYYYRESKNYATTVMPYDLGASMYSEGVYQLFRIEDMTSESIIIKELSQGECIPANTPCIFKGILAFLKENMPLSFGAIDDQFVGSATFKGTYQSMYLEPGAGYYISGGKFYNDGASIRPFRGYIEGDVNGVKSFSVLIDTPDGLKDITDQFSKEDIYNLQGIRMNNVQKGINIKGGKKVLVK